MAKKFGTKVGTPTWKSLVLVRVVPAPERAEEGKAHIPVGYVLQQLPDALDLLTMNRRGWHPTPEATANAALQRDLGKSVPLQAIAHRTPTDEYPHHLFIAEITEDDWAWGTRPADSRAIYLNVDNFYVAVRKGFFAASSFDRLVEATLILPMGRDKAAPVAA